MTHRSRSSALAALAIIVMAATLAVSPAPGIPAGLTDPQRGPTAPGGTADQGAGLLQSSTPRVPPLANPLATTSVAVGTDPWSATYDPSNGYVYVPNEISGTVSILDGTSVISTVTVGSEPMFAIFDAANRCVYVLNLGSRTATVLNGTSIVGSVSVGYAPRGGTYDSGNGYVYVANQGSDNVTVIDGLRVVGTVDTGSSPMYATYDATNGLVYVSNYGTSNLTVINGTTFVSSVKVGSEPIGATYDSGNGYVYVPNYGSGTVSVVDHTSVLTTLTVGSDPGAGSYDATDGYVYIPNLNYGVAVINGTTLLGQVPAGTYPETSTYDAGNGCVYVPNYGSSNVTVISGTTVVGSGSAGRAPQFPAVDSASGDIYVPNSQGTTVSVLSTPGVYTVTFSASGLTSKTAWTVDLNGTPRSSDLPTIAFAEVNASYPYVITPPSGYSAVPATGTVSVSGTNVRVAVAFSQRTFAVSFRELGLAANTPWSVNLSGMVRGSTSPAITFTEPNGTYSFSVLPRAGYQITPRTGTLTVAGADQSQTVTFVRPSYSVTFTESGLPAGTNWSVAVGGASYSSTGTRIAASEPNGTYPYAVSTYDATYSAPSGSLTVNGKPTSEAVAFTLVAYAVTFTETGLPTGTKWWVNATDGTPTSSTATTLVVREPNGTHPYSVATTDKSYASAGGSFSVEGAAASETVTFARVTYAVTFTETGLPTGTEWWIRVAGGSAIPSTNGTLSMNKPNGTYSFEIIPLAGYGASPSSGSIMVKGHPVSQALGFSSTSSVQPLGLPPMEGYEVLAAVLAVAVAVVGVVLLLRRRRAGPLPDPANAPPASEVDGPPAGP